MATVLIRCLVVLAGLLADVARGIEIPERTNWVVDSGQVIGVETCRRLDALLSDFSERTGKQAAVLVLPDLGWEPIQDRSKEIMRQWQLGGEEGDTGLLLVIVPSEGKVHIETGADLRSEATDTALPVIVRETMLPLFREDQLDQGVERGMEAILELIEGSQALADLAPKGGRKGRGVDNFMELSLGERVLIGGFIFGILGLFTGIGLLAEGAGWMLYFFLIPFWSVFPIAVLGVQGTLVLLAVYLVGFPVVKLSISRSEWYRHGGAGLFRGRSR